MFLIGIPQILHIQTGKALLKIHSDGQWLPGVGSNHLSKGRGRPGGGEGSEMASPGWWLQQLTDLQLWVLRRVRD